MTDTRFVVAGNVAFDTSSDVIRASSYPLLDEVAQALLANPRFTQVRVEGHTDDRGAESTNYQLSELRARAVKAYLVSKGVAEQRVVAEGFGPERPIADNATADGRRRNRRVEFVVLEIEGRRVVADREPLAKVSAMVNDIDARKPTQETWRDAELGLGLFRAWRLQSHERSSAEVTFRDASQLGMRENTLVVIYGAVAGRSKTFEAAAELESGALRSRLAELAGDQGPSLALKTPSAEAELHSGSSLVTVDESKTSRVANHQGQQANVWGRTSEGARRAKSVAVAAGYGSKVTPGQDPSPPKPLPPAPTWDDDSDLVLLRALPAQGTALGPVVAPLPVVQAGHRLRLEMARQPSGADVVVAVQAPAAAQLELRELPDGDYYLRVAAIDDDQFEGAPSSPRAVRVRTVPLRAGAYGEAPRVVLGDQLELSDGLKCADADMPPASQLTLRRPGPQRLTCQTDTGARAEFALNVVLPPDGVIALPAGPLVGGRATPITVASLVADDLSVTLPDGTSTSLTSVGDGAWEGAISVSPQDADTLVVTLVSGGETLGTQALPLTTAAAPVDDEPPPEAVTPSSEAPAAGPVVDASELFLSPWWGVGLMSAGVAVFVAGGVLYSLVADPAVLGVEVPAVALYVGGLGLVGAGLLALAGGAGLAGASYLLAE